MDQPGRAATFTGDPPRAIDPEILEDRRELGIVALERTRMPILITDPRKPNNPAVLANQAFLELTGYSADEVIGRNCRFLQGPETNPDDVQAIRDALTRGDDQFCIELLNYRKDGSTFWNQLAFSPVHDENGELIYYFASQKDVTERRRAQELERMERLLLKEVDHRAMNALALVQSIVRLSRQSTLEAFAATVTRRVDALAYAHRLLARSAWAGADLADLLGVDSGFEGVETSGPPVHLPAHLVQPLALVLQELIANAHQHGALSAPAGKIAMRWERLPTALEIHWLEDWSAPRREPPQNGFGLDLVNGVVTRQLNGAVTMNWPAQGMSATFTIPW
jgi:PAS domain S-box-containing protein